MSDQQQPVSVQSLVEAIDQRARQAGTEGATTVLTGLLGSVSETLASIEARLASLEQSAVSGGGDSAVIAQVDQGLQALNSRLGRLEEAFVRAVDDSSAGTVSISEQVVEAVTAFMDARFVDAPVEPPRPVESASPPPPAVPPELVERLTGLGEAMTGVVAGRAELTESLAILHASLAKLTEAVGAIPRAPVEPPAWKATADQLNHSLEEMSATTAETRVAMVRAIEAGAEQIGRAQAPLEDRLANISRLVEQLASRSAATQPGSDTREVDHQTQAVLDRVAADVERLLRQEQSARLVHLVETRMGAGLDAIVRRIEALSGEVNGVAEAAEATRALASSAQESSATAGEVVSSVQRRVEELGAAVSTISAELVASLGDRIEGGHRDTRSAFEAGLAGVSSSHQDSAEAITGHVRREAEQLTQRVAALSMAVERLRDAVDSLAEESAQTIGRKATEVTRRLAADFGFKGRRNDPDNDRDRGRELGPGR